MQPRGKWIAAALLGLVFAWAYAPTLGMLAHSWSSQPDYSHGFLVPPLALLFLWLRRDRMPATTQGSLSGLVLLLLAMSVHVAGGMYYLEALQGWSIPVWIAGICVLLGGWKFLQWCLPALIFLLFMVPLPYRLEIGLSGPLQRISTEVSCWVLQSLGYPALAEGNVIQLDQLELEVARACSGLRIFVSIVALAYAYAILVKRPWWMKALLFACVPLVAITANSARVIAIALIVPHLSTSAGRAWLHDVAGWLVIPLAAGLLGAALWYFGKLFVQVQSVTGRELLRST
jgi:exosortase